LSQKRILIVNRRIKSNSMLKGLQRGKKINGNKSISGVGCFWNLRRMLIFFDYLTIILWFEFQDDPMMYCKYFRGY